MEHISLVRIAGLPSAISADTESGLGEVKCCYVKDGSCIGKISRDILDIFCNN